MQVVFEAKLFLFLKDSLSIWKRHFPLHLIHPLFYSWLLQFNFEVMRMKIPTRSVTVAVSVIVIFFYCSPLCFLNMPASGTSRNCDRAHCTQFRQRRRLSPCPAEHWQKPAEACLQAIYFIHSVPESRGSQPLLPEHEQHTVNHGEALWVSKFN